MIKKSDFYPRKWMSAETLTRSGAVYTIEKFDQEVFPDPPQGDRSVLDLVAKLPTRQEVPGQRPGEPASWREDQRG